MNNKALQEAAAREVARERLRLADRMGLDYPGRATDILLAQQQEAADRALMRPVSLRRTAAVGSATLAH